MKFRHESIISFIWILVFSVSSQFLWANDIYFENFNLHNGLPNNTVEKVLQDELGFIWAGTMYGLYRYDGYEFREIYPQSPNEKYSNFTITDLKQDNHGKIWIASSNEGVNCYDIYAEKFVSFENTALLNQIDATAVEPVGDSMVLVGTANGLIIVSSNSGKISEGCRLVSQQLYPDPQNLKPNNNYINCILIENKALSFTCWVGTNAMLFTLDLEDFSITAKYSNRGSVRDLLLTPGGNLLVGYWNSGIELLENSSDPDLAAQVEAMNKMVGEYRITSILQESSSAFWIGTNQNGLFHFDFSQNDLHYERYSHSPGDQNTIGSNSINSIIKDRSGLIWIGHDIGGGLTKVYADASRLKIFKNIFSGKSTYDYTITSIASDPASSSIWIGTIGEGIAVINSNEEVNLQISASGNGPLDIQTNNIQSLTFDKYGNIWVGTSGQGIIVIPHHILRKLEQNAPVTGNAFYTIDKARFPILNNYIYDLLFDDEGNLWIATHQGLFQGSISTSFDDEDSFEKFYDNLKIHNVFENHEPLDRIEINTIHKNDSGKILVCTENTGLLVIASYVEGRVDYYNYRHMSGKDNTISSDKAFSGCFDSAGHFWITTANGLDHIDLISNEVSRMLSNDEIGNFQMLNAVFDSEGHLWMPLNYGIMRFDTVNQKLEKFYKSNTEDNYLNTSAFYIDKHGVIYAGSRNSIIYFDPSDLTDPSFNSPLYITDFKINNTRITPGLKFNGRIVIAKNINEVNSLKFTSRDINILFELASLDYKNMGSIQYRYKLNGINEEWTILNQGNRTISFSNLKPGNYKLLVNNTNSQGLWNTENRELQFKVLPPPWKSIPAILFYLVIFILIIFFLQRLWLIRQKEKNAIVLAQYEKEQSEKLNNLKLQFFMNISHEFKTPLSLIIAPLGTLLNNLEGAENRHQLHLISRNANRLLYLINQIIDFRKIDKEILTLNYFKINISDFTGHILQLFNLTADEKNISLVIETRNPELIVQLDPHQIETVFYNLLSNALRYTPENGQIKISIRSSNDACEITVSDTGPGIAPAQIPLIFERFHFTPDPTGAKSGSGIGLSHTKSIIELHKGAIEVSSQKGKGTQFKITLPLIARAADQKEIPEIDIDEFFSQGHAVIQQTYSDLEAMEILDIQEEIKPEKRIEQDQPPLKPYTVVVAEDNDELRSYLFSSLSKRYEKVYSASNGEEALKLIRDNKPDLLISDVAMPRMDGLELTRIIKEDEDIKKMFIVLVTAKNYEEERISALEAGVDVYIFKPFNIQYLMLRIDKLFERKEKFEEEFTGGMFTLMNDSKIPNPDKLFIDRAIGIVEENLSNSDFKIESMYNELNVSRAQLYRKISKLTGFSVKEFVREIRLYRAEQIIREDNLTVNEISYMVGFGSPTYFSICFKRKFGLSPVQYKSKHYKSPQFLT